MKQNLTGIWHGLYSYPQVLDPVYFVATLISSGCTFSGSTHEAIEGKRGATLKVFAHLEGVQSGASLSFTKQYDGTANWSHSVAYDGTVLSDGSEIEGRWSIAGQWSGPFLMIRGNRASESVVRRVFATV